MNLIHINLLNFEKEKQLFYNMKLGTIVFKKLCVGLNFENEYISLYIFLLACVCKCIYNDEKILRMWDCIKIRKYCF